MKRRGRSSKGRGREAGGIAGGSGGQNDGSPALGGQQSKAREPGNRDGPGLLLVYLIVRRPICFFNSIV